MVLLDWIVYTSLIPKTIGLLCIVFFNLLSKIMYRVILNSIYIYQPARKTHRAVIMDSDATLFFYVFVNLRFFATLFLIPQRFFSDVITISLPCKTRSCPVWMIVTPCFDILMSKSKDYYYCKQSRLISLCKIYILIINW